MKDALLLPLLLTACIRSGPAANHPFNDPATDEPVPVTSAPQVEVGPTRAINDRDYLLAALDAIDASEDRIRVAQYLLFDDSPVDSLLEHLTDAADRGVHIQVLADEEGSETEAVLSALTEHDIETQIDTKNTTLHNKLVVADDVVLVGSHNLTDAAMERNNEGSVLVNDAEVAAWYAAWFDAMWIDPTPDPQTQSWTRTDVVPLADRMITTALLDCIDQATEDIELLMYAIAYNDAYPGSDVDLLLGALEKAHARGIEVHVIVDGSFWIIDNQINNDAIARLDASGIPVWRTPASVTNHAKVLRCDDTVVVSDANWSYSGLELMHGTSLKSTTYDLSAAYRSWMLEIREEADVL